ncbi:hypothetical protein MMC30_001226 [Trapelia coarctata]|nr:hypothetical protein [Trapelia coarctata]
MFQTFTGNSRRPRQVNLSGRNNNPFAAVSGAPTSRAPLNSQDALAHAQQERRARQQERDRLQAAKTLQRTWRGHRSRKAMSTNYRQEWDFREGITNPKLMTREGHYTSAEEALAQLRLFTHFASPADPLDVRRMQRFTAKSIKRNGEPLWQTAGSTDHGWRHPLLSAAKICLAMIQRSCTASYWPGDVLEDLLFFLSEASSTIPEQLSLYSNSYYKTLKLLLQTYRTSHAISEPIGSAHAHAQWPPSSFLYPALLKPLKGNYANVIVAYEGFVEELLITPDLPRHLQLTTLANGLDSRVLTTALLRIMITEPSDNFWRRKTSEEIMWLLAHYIYFRRTVKPGAPVPALQDEDFVRVVSKLLLPLPEDIGSRIDAAGMPSTNSIPNFIAYELSTLVTKESVTSLLNAIESNASPTDSKPTSWNDIAALASYVLTLLRVFRGRRDDILMWLYLGSMSTPMGSSNPVFERLPAIKYFCEAVVRTEVFQLISQDPENVIALLKTDTSRQSRGRSGDVSRREQEWRIILLFLELYPLLLKVMDDDEFFNGATSTEEHQSWTRRSALPLARVKQLTIFLKNLAFTMYWDAAKMLGAEEPETTTSLAEYFGNTSVVSPKIINLDALNKPEDIVIAGVSGMSLSYLKGMVTGVLRMIYERDSRRKFLPDGHWLMTKYFDMKGFILEVVREERYKDENQDADDREDIMQTDTDEESDELVLVGTQRTQQLRRIEGLKKRQKKTARRKLLGAVIPRLEILQNMPFFIPFSKRVEIFHEFVHSDQRRRRDGAFDADTWRMRLAQDAARDRRNVHEELSKHSARIRRDHCFEDAYNQFYELGEGLKEPIQISFVDQFGTEEAGIDGGGVTKEFLTSVTSEAFTPTPDSRLFVENDQHLLYPNPATIEEQKANLRHLNFAEGSPEWNEGIRDLLRQYEFLGRVVGKCLYEGILIDIHFAPFFLKKWALSGGSNSASNESDYRATINDLRDLDEALYQGLLQLKNYPGNVEDFSLDFTITDTIEIPADDTVSNGRPRQINITRELQTGRGQTPVTNENRLTYISMVARYRLQVQSQPQTRAFLRGLGSMIQPSWLSMFNQAELQTLIGGGPSEIDVADIRRNTLYGGVYVIGDDNEEHPTVKMFWDVMEDFSDADRRKLLKYVTSTPRAPILGFKQLNPPFSIRDSGSDQTRLPSTSTCVNLLKLPIYHSKRLLRQKLEYAINAGAGFNLS